MIRPESDSPTRSRHDEDDAEDEEGGEEEAEEEEEEDVPEDEDVSSLDVSALLFLGTGKAMKETRRGERRDLA